MATGGGGSISRSSEPFHDFSCSVCAKDDKHTEGERFCVECNEIFCTPCLVFHNKIAIMRQHELLDQDKMVARKPQLHLVQLPTSRCKVHPGRVIDMYCGQDDIVCCTVCIAEDHRSCEGVIYIPRKAKNIQTSQEFLDVNATIDTMKADIENLKKNKQLDLDRLTAQHRGIKATIREIRDQLNKHLDDLEEMARDKLERKFKIHEDRINATLAKLEHQLSEMEDFADKLKNIHNESQLFVDLKLTQINQREGKQMYENIQKSVGKPAIHLVPNKEIFNLLKQKSMGTVEDTEPFDSVFLHGDFNINDSTTCAITGLCQMLDGNILMTDMFNRNLKLIDTSYKVLAVAEFDFQDSPFGVCRTSPTEVAIAFREGKKVQFAKVTYKISLKGSFNVGESCRGIAYNNGLLYVSCGGDKSNNDGPGQVKVYDMSGQHLQSYIKDQNNKNIFSIPYGISLSECRTKLHVVDTNEIVTMNLDGTKSTAFTHPDMKLPLNIYVVNNDDLIVSGHDSDNVILFDKNGQQKAVLLKKKDGIKQPVSVLYDKPNSRLIVSMYKSNKLRFYNLL